MSPLPKPSADRATEDRRGDADLGGALLNPFATVGVAAAPANALPPAAQQADWGLPLAAVVFGIVGVGALLRKLVS